MSTDYRTTDTDAVEGDHVAICPVCGTRTTGESAEAMYDAANRHNDLFHDGDRIARSVKPKPKHIRAFLNGVSRRYGSTIRDELERKMRDVEPWGALDE